MTPCSAYPPLPDKAQLIREVQQHRTKWDARFRPAGLEPVGPGEESVWDYPRPPVLAPYPGALRVRHAGCTVAATSRAIAIKETAGAPTVYFPPEDVMAEWLVPNGGVGICEWKGASVALDLRLPGGDRIADAAWTYPDPLADLGIDYPALAGWYAFYPARLACFVDDEPVRPQPGSIYGGWVTRRIRGPVKGAPGSAHW